MQIDLLNVDAMATGCAFLGCGGGGDVIAAQAAKAAIEEFGPVPLIRLEELDDDAFVLPCADMGAPTIFFEKVANGDEGRLLVEAMEKIHGRPVAALMPAEIGGSNGLTPIVWAARLGLPMVDADGIGRAYPELNMIALELNGVPISPSVLADERGNVVTIDSLDGPWMERIARSITVEFGGAAAFAGYPLTAARAREAAIIGSITRAIDIGQALADVDGDRVRGLCEHVGAREVVRGKIVEIEGSVEGGFVVGSATIEGSGPDSGRTLRLEYQNEFLVALENGRPLVMVPDIISLLDVNSGDPIATERMRYGMRVALVGLQAPEIWTSDAGLALGGPRAFGYPFDYQQMGVSA